MVNDNQPGHIDWIKQTNAGAVYRLIDIHGPVSRIDLSRLAQLAPASITKIVREMLDAHLVQETEIQESLSRGRPATGLILDTDAWHYLSVNIGRTDISLSLHDLSGRGIVNETRPLDLIGNTTLLSNIVVCIDQFFTRYQHQLERMTAITITLPGIIDSVRGVVHRMPFYDVCDMPLKSTLEKHTGLMVYVQHDINAWTMSEGMSGTSRDVHDMILVVIGNNVGAGVITGGHLLHAGSSKLVEIGHTQIDPCGKRCYCGNHGCLDTVASVESILSLARQRMTQSMETLMHQQPLSINSLCDAALRGDLLARNIILGVGVSVGRILAVMVNLFNPEKILIGSPLNRAAEILHPAIAHCIQQQALPAYSQNIIVEGSQSHQCGTLSGSALIKEAMYNGSLLIRLLNG